MLFTISFPLEDTIDSDSFKDAIKKYININRNIKINQMIIADQSNRMRANIRYYTENGRDKVGINMFPIGWNYPISIVNSDRNNGYVAPRYLQTDSNVFLPISPLSPTSSIVSPIMTPFIPTVINIPNV
jgi:hypothetical protein